MPSNTDNSGSARAARLRRISAARGPVPVIRPNIGSMALDAILGRAACCPSEPPAPTLVLINCGVPPQTLDPSIEYFFGNNTSETVELLLTDNSGNTQSYTIEPLGGVGPFSNLVSWQSDFSICDLSQTLIPFSISADGCLYQVLDSSVLYRFEAVIDPPPFTIIIRNASNVDTTVPIPDENPVGPFTNLTSWRPAGCAPPS
jgi:hypothetical protein